MHKGIYIALSGSVLKQDLLDVISNNVANANTVGYKKDRVSFRDYLISQLNGAPETDDGRAMSELSAVRTDFAQGHHVKTGNALDVALEGSGFLSLEGGRYTRKGDLSVGRDGYLVTQGGLRVLGAGGPIRLPAGKVEISPSGAVTAGGVAVDTLKIVEFADRDALREAEDGHFTTTLVPAKSTATVSQGHLESSNVDVVKEMVQMIAAMREFETYQKAIQAFDEAAAKVNNEMARV